MTDTVLLDESGIITAEIFIIALVAVLWTLYHLIAVSSLSLLTVATLYIGVSAVFGILYGDLYILNQ